MLGVAFLRRRLPRFRMSETARPRLPSKMGSAGRSLWRRLTADDDLDFDLTALLTMELACRQADDVAQLEKLLQDQGAVLEGSQGQPRLSSVFAELRAQRLTLSRLIAAIGLPEANEAVGTSPSRRKAQRAADARWSRQAVAREARRGRPA